MGDSWRYEPVTKGVLYDAIMSVSSSSKNAAEVVMKHPALRGSSALGQVTALSFSAIHHVLDDLAKQIKGNSWTQCSWIGPFSGDRCELEEGHYPAKPHHVPDGG